MYNIDDLILRLMIKLPFINYGISKNYNLISLDEQIYLLNYIENNIKYKCFDATQKREWTIINIIARLCWLETTQLSILDNIFKLFYHKIPNEFAIHNLLENKNCSQYIKDKFKLIELLD